jgi:acyl-CoA-binding protein
LFIKLNYKKDSAEEQPTFNVIAEFKINNWEFLKGKYTDEKFDWFNFDQSFWNYYGRTDSIE